MIASSGEGGCGVWAVRSAKSAPWEDYLAFAQVLELAPGGPIPQRGRRATAGSSL